MGFINQLITGGPHLVPYFSGMNIHFNPAMTWGSRHGTRVLTHPQIKSQDYSKIHLKNLKTCVF